MDPVRRSARPSIALVVAAACYLGLRALILHTNFDAVAIPIFELPVMGNLAHLLSSPERGVALARYYDNCGGHILTGILGAPLYALLGSSYLALKLVPLALGLCTLVMLWKILADHFDRRAADLFAFLFAFAPPTLTKYSLLAKGNHFENLPFQVLVLALFLGMHVRGTRPGRLFAVGAAAGFALFIYFGSIVLVSILALLHVLVRGRRSLLDLPAALGGAAAGIAPLAWVQISTGGQPGQFLRAKLEAVPSLGLDHLGRRLSHLFRDVLPSSGVFEDLGPLPGRLAEAVFLGVFALAWLLLARQLCRSVLALRRERSPRGSRARELARLEAWKLLPFVAFLPLFAVVISGTNFSFAHYAAPVEVGRYRYLVPHLLVALSVIALASAHLGRRAGAARYLGGGLGALALGTGLFTLPLVDPRPNEVGIGRAYSGSFFLRYANVVMRSPARDAQTLLPRWDPSAIHTALAGLGPVHRNEAYSGVGHFSAWVTRSGAARAHAAGQARLPLEQLLYPHPPELRISVSRGAGSLLRRVRGVAGDLEGLAAELAFLEDQGHPLLPWVVEGLCLDMAYPLARDVLRMSRVSERMEAAVPPSLRGHLRRGRGAEVGRLVARGLASDLALARHVIGTLGDGDGGDFWFGLGWGLAEKAPGAPPAALVEELVPELQRERALEGYGACLRMLHGPDPLLPDFSSPEWGPELQAALARGARWPGYPQPYRW